MNFNFSGKSKKKVQQNRITVNFRLTSDEEQELYNWIKENGVVGGDSGFIKGILYKEYKKQLEEK